LYRHVYDAKNSTFKTQTPFVLVFHIILTTDTDYD